MASLPEIEFGLRRTPIKTKQGLCRDGTRLLPGEVAVEIEIDPTQWRAVS